MTEYSLGQNHKEEISQFQVGGGNSVDAGLYRKNFYEIEKLTIRDFKPDKMGWFCLKMKEKTVRIPK